jgi:hypothetical protein
MLLHGFEIAIQSGNSHKILFASYHIAHMSAVMLEDSSTTARYSFVYLARLGYQRNQPRNYNPIPAPLPGLRIPKEPAGKGQ